MMTIFSGLDARLGCIKRHLRSIRSDVGTGGGTIDGGEG